MGIVGRDELLLAARSLYAAQASIQRAQMDVLSLSLSLVPPPNPSLSSSLFPSRLFSTVKIGE